MHYQNFLKGKNREFMADSGIKIYDQQLNLQK